MVKEYVRKPSMFEKLLLVVGILVVIVGYGLIHKLVILDNALSWDMLIAIFLWMLMILLIIVTAVTENVKEEIAVILRKEIQKLRILRFSKEKSQK